MIVNLVGYSANGLCNQFVSLQTIAGISGLLPNEDIRLIWSNRGDKIENPQKHLHNKTDLSKISNIVSNEVPSIFDLVEFNYNNVKIFSDDSHIQDRMNLNFANVQETFVNCTSNTENIKEFANFKKEFIFEENRESYLTVMLVPYAKFFFNRTKEVDIAISKLKFKKEYVDLANKISIFLGDYNGTHIRRMPDHHQYYIFSQNSLIDGLNKFDNKSLPIVCSLDWFDDPMVKNCGVELIFLEEIILTHFADDFVKLPFRNETVLALISLLVMLNAKDFVGTPRSTFTNVIHSLRNNIVDEKFKFYPGASDGWDRYDVNAKPYSWNGSGDGISWEREFKESKLNI
jgi:hypothetical protein